MEAKDVKVGMKVVVHSKSHGCSFSSWARENPRANKFLDDFGFLIVELDAGAGDFLLHDGKKPDEGVRMFYASDFEPAKIEVGDAVRVRPDLKYGDGGNGALAGGDMLRMASNEGVVEKVKTCSRPDCEHFLVTGLGGWCWTEHMLDLVRKAKKPAEKPADRRPTVGDWVEVVAIDGFHKWDSEAIPLGMKLRVIHDDHSDRPFECMASGTQIRWMSEAEVKLTTPPEQKPNLPKCVNCTAHGTPFICHICVNPTHADEPATVLKSDADAAVRRAYIDGQVKIANSRVLDVAIDMFPTDDRLAKFWEAD